MKFCKIAALLLAVLLLLGGCASAEPSGEADPVSVSQQGSGEEKITYAPKSVRAEYPASVGAGMNADQFIESKKYISWMQNFREDARDSALRQDGMDRFYQDLLSKMLGTDTGENKVCSPLNIYLATAMLAEITDGASREQILSALKTDSIEELRERTAALWKANYADTPSLTSLLANSVWMRNDFPYRQEALERLSADYYASSFSGEMGSEEFSNELREWTNENTHGLLSGFVQNMSLSPETVLALVSTVYYSAAWTDEFSRDRTDRQIFHGVSGDREVSMMHADRTMNCFRTERFCAVSMSLRDSGNMFFFLPEEGVSVQELASDPDVISVTRGSEDVKSFFPIVHLSVPKFQVSEKTDLTTVLRELGITDIMEFDKADFSALCDCPGEIALTNAEHTALLKIDEEGVVGAAYTMLLLAGAAMPVSEIHFVLDRPFLFTLTAADGSILFTGIVQSIG